MSQSFRLALQAAGLHPRDIEADGRIRRELTPERLKQLLHYDPATGVFTRVVAAGRQAAGSVAGNADGDGYLKLCVDGTTHKAHRLAWFYVYGKWPSHVIDHIDGNRANNAISNLRDVPRMVNSQNRKRAQSNSATGVLGVIADRGRFVATVGVAGRCVHLGRFDTVEAAHAAYLKAKRALHEGCTL
jgi:hypothetical protein